MNIIGQKQIQSKITAIIGLNKFPRFALFIGPEGCGKRTIMNWTASKLNAKDIIKYEKPGVDQVRSMISDAYKLINTTVFIMPNIHLMSTAAKNALLKITEEPPNKAYFLMSVDSVENALETIRSRSVTFQMQSYSKEELNEYLNSQKTQPNASEKHFILNVSNNIADIQKLLTNDVSAFSDYVNLVVDNIAVVSGPNSFKLADKLAVKSEDNKFDVKLFFQAFESVCLQKIVDEESEMDKYADAIEITSKAISELSISGINKQMLIDEWILSIRKAWM